MSYPILYSATETNFDHNGIGILGDCVSCEATEEANGIFELAMKYPMDGIHFLEISDRCIVKARIDQYRTPQLFRIYAISKPMNGIVTVLANHISYDLSGIPVSPFSANTAPLALERLKSMAVVDCPFEFWTDKETEGNFLVATPASIRSRLGGVTGSILDVYGGEYEFDNYTVRLHKNRGENRGVSIRYGKNLTDIQQEQNCSSVATGVYPYWFGDVSGVSELVELPEKIITAPGTYDFVKIKILDLSGSFDSKPTIEQLRTYTETYVNESKIGIPDVSLTVSFVQLDQSEEYKHMHLLERVSLFDTVNVEFPALNVSATAKAVKMVHDILSNRVKSVTLGSVRANIADTIYNQKAEAEEIAKKEAKKAVSSQSSLDVFNRLTADGSVQGLFYEDGSIYINGEYIKAKTFSAETYTFMEPGIEEANAILSHYVGNIIIPEYDLPKYDFNGDGVVNPKDAALALQAASGSISLKDFPGAEKTRFRVTIDVTDPNRAILFSGTNMWGRTTEKWYGLDGSNNGKFHDVVLSPIGFMVGEGIIELSTGPNGAQMGINGEVKTLSWRDNGDGTFTPVGS